ncbi:MAG TPA: non-homologous end-joining DNA ligase [Opitutaceae bacterium]|nr:non-homologous end-joining DNA ligase [Opitutaceae bacterium]
MAAKDSTLTIEGRTLAVSNLGKVLYPEAGFTKGDVIQYYIDAGPAILPHLQDRPLTMKRYPEGVGKFFFYEKNCPPYRPRWMRTAKVKSERRGEMRFCLVNELASLVWLANLADLELHVSLARAPALGRPTAMVFDLDPGEGADILACAEVAFWLREALAALKLEAFPKTSGSKGLQLYVPLNTATTFERTKAASLEIARAVESRHPDRVVTNMRKELRRRKVLIDWSQNEEHKTTVCVYSLRATPVPQVSTPLRWSELQKFRKAGKTAAFRFGPKEILARLRRHGDLFQPVLELKQKL